MTNLIVVGLFSSPFPRTPMSLPHLSQAIALGLNPKLIAIDGDGVLLNYNPVFGLMWFLHFGEVITPKDPTSFWSANYWGVEEPARGHPFWDTFSAHGWTKMEALPGALDACQRLVAAGYELVCVTSIPSKCADDRLQNLKALGFPIDRVIASGSVPHDAANPKKEAIEALRPAWFIDDEARKLTGFDLDLGLVLVDTQSADNPNKGVNRDHLHLSVPNLAGFADWLLDGEGQSHRLVQD